jgi:hypothetical protein
MGGMARIGSSPRVACLLPFREFRAAPRLMDLLARRTWEISPNRWGIDDLLCRSNDVGDVGVLARGLALHARDTLRTATVALPRRRELAGGGSRVQNTWRAAQKGSMGQWGRGCAPWSCARRTLRSSALACCASAFSWGARGWPWYRWDRRSRGSRGSQQLRSPPWLELHASVLDKVGSRDCRLTRHARCETAPSVEGVVRFRECEREREGALFPAKQQGRRRGSWRALSRSLAGMPSPTPCLKRAAAGGDGSAITAGRRSTV